MNKIKYIQPKHCLSLLLIIITFIAFSQVTGHEFVSFDDSANVSKNPYMNPATVKSIEYFWKRPYFFASTFTLWAIQAMLAKDSTPDVFGSTLDPHVFHLTNLIVHILSVLMVFLILRLLFKHDWAAFGGALLFALHPVQVEPVAWVTGLKDVLSGLLSLLAVWQYLLFAGSGPIIKTIDDKYVESYRVKDDQNRKESLKKVKKWFHYSFSAVFFILAMTAKPTAAVVPVIILILDYYFLKQPLKKSIFLLAGWVIISLPVMILIKSAQPDMEIKFLTPLWARPLIMGDALMFYLYKLIYPFSLCIDYGRTPESVLQYKSIYLSGIIPYLLLIVIWIYRKKSRQLVAILGIFIAGILPVSGLIPFLYQNFSTVADRYLYLSMLGPAIGLAWLLSSIWKKPVIIISALILALLGVRCHDQVRHWKNTIALFKHTLKVNSNSALAHFDMGIVLGRENKYDEAVGHYSAAIRINPSYNEAYYCLGNIFFTQGKFDKAIMNYLQALKIKPDYLNAHSNIGIAFFKQRRYEKAIYHFLEALKINRNNRAAQRNLKIALRAKGKSEADISNYFKNLKIKTDNTGSFYRQGIFFERQGKFSDAAVSYSKAIKLKPDNAGAYFNKGNVLFRLKKFNEAIANYKQALKIKPDFAEAHNNLGFILERQGKIKKAINHYSAALRINPDYNNAKNNLMRAQKKEKQ